MVQLLLQRGPEVNSLCKSYGGSTLLCAMIAGCIELVEKLLEAGADPRMKVEGETTVMWVKGSERSLVPMGRVVAGLLRVEENPWLYSRVGTGDDWRMSSN